MSDDPTGTIDPQEISPSLDRVYRMPGHLIRRAHQIASADFMECTKDHNLTPVQYATLVVVDSYPGIDQRTLASTIAFDRSTIGDVIQRLELRGLLMRHEGTDRRTKVVSLTTAGERILVSMDELVLESQFRILSPLSDGEQLILMFLLSKLVNLTNGLSGSPLKGAAAETDAYQSMRNFLRATFTRIGDEGSDGNGQSGIEPRTTPLK